MTRKFFISVWLFMGAFVLVNFQNCAAPEGTTAALQNNIVDGEVRIVDRWASEKVQFAASSYFVDPDVDSVNIQGFCENSGESFLWEMVRPSNNGDLIFGAGSVDCVNGQFALRVAISDVSLSSCSDSLELRALGHQAGQVEALTQVRWACL